jgi:hypothetical protein
MPNGQRTLPWFVAAFSLVFGETIADHLSKGGCTWGCMSAVDSSGPTIFIANAHPDGKRFVVRAEEKLTAFPGLEAAIWRFRCSPGRTMPVRPHLTTHYSDVTRQNLEVF